MLGKLVGSIRDQQSHNSACKVAMVRLAEFRTQIFHLLIGYAPRPISPKACQQDARAFGILGSWSICKAVDKYHKGSCVQRCVQRTQAMYGSSDVWLRGWTTMHSQHKNPVHW